MHQLHLLAKKWHAEDLMRNNEKVRWLSLPHGRNVAYRFCATTGTRPEEDMNQKSHTVSAYRQGELKPAVLHPVAEAATGLMPGLVNPVKR